VSFAYFIHCEQNGTDPNGRERRNGKGILYIHIYIYTAHKTWRAGEKQRRQSQTQTDRHIWAHTHTHKSGWNGWAKSIGIYIYISMYSRILVCCLAFGTSVPVYVTKPRTWHDMEMKAAKDSGATSWPYRLVATGYMSCSKSRMWRRRAINYLMVSFVVLVSWFDGEFV